MSNRATIYMMPVPIAEGAVETLSPQVKEVAGKLKYFIVENLRTARRTLKLMHPQLVIDDLHFSEIDKHSGLDTQTLKEWLKAGYEIGVLSEAGCPGIADPGAEIAGIAQQMGAKIIPLTGPNSIILALMASGLNGQSFAFHGYLPVKEPGRSQRIKQLEAISARERQTQIFIETPYRNGQLLTEVTKNCQPKTRLCIALDITGSSEKIITQTIGDWKQKPVELGKHPAVFLILA
jgi:16S rRNA (cytidine1402-2'-O)-methyltransferase